MIIKLKDVQKNYFKMENYKKKDFLLWFICCFKIKQLTSNTSFIIIYVYYINQWYKNKLQNTYLPKVHSPKALTDLFKIVINPKLI